MKKLLKNSTDTVPESLPSHKSRLARTKLHLRVAIVLLPTLAYPIPSFTQNACWISRQKWRKVMAVIIVCLTNSVDKSTAKWFMRGNATPLTLYSTLDCCRMGLVRHFCFIINDSIWSMNLMASKLEAALNKGLPGSFHLSSMVILCLLNMLSCTRTRECGWSCRRVLVSIKPSSLISEHCKWC